MQIIGIGGLAKAGKTTVANMLANHLVERRLGNPVLVQFAGPLKRASEEVGASKADQPELYRKFCQEVGSNFRDPEYVSGVTGPHYWVDRARETALGYAKLEIQQYGNTEYNDLPLWRASMDLQPWQETVLIFDDVRYDNELALVNEFRGVLLFVDAGKRLDLSDPVYTHNSETLAMEYTMGSRAADCFHWHINNNHAYDDLSASVRDEFDDMLLTPEFV